MVRLIFRYSWLVIATLLFFYNAKAENYTSLYSSNGDSTSLKNEIIFNKFDSIVANEKIYHKSLSSIDETTTKERQTAKGLTDQVERENRFTSTLTPTDLNTLPIGLKFGGDGGNNTKVTIAVASVAFTPAYAELTVYAKVTIPQQPGELFFAARGIKLSYSGGIIGDAHLVLIGDVLLNINGQTASLVIHGSGGLNNRELTYVSMDCNGFKELGISAEVQLSRNLFIPVDYNGNEIDDPLAKVSGYFSTVVKDWNDIIASISLPSFAISGLKGFTFNINEAVFDFSDSRNSPQINYPAGYASKYLTPGLEKMWRGIYIRNLSVILPPMFKKKSSGAVQISANDMLIDNNGVSGLFVGQNVLPLSEGSASGWKFSVNDLALELEANHIKAAGFSGELGLPVMKDKALAYNAIISQDGDYQLQVATTENIDFNLWQAKVSLASNSYIKLQVVDNQFLPMANLNGSMSIGTSLANMNEIVFQDLKLQTVAPYMSVGYFGYRGEVSIKGFPVSITDIAIDITGNSSALRFGVNVDLAEKLFYGSTRLIIKSSMNNSEGGKQWEYQGTTINQLNIKADIAKVMTLEGSITIMDNDPTYGDGFQGEINMGLQPLKIGSIKAKIIFGKTDFKYWLVDATVDFGSAGIPVLGPFAIKGLGGGAYYSMVKSGFDPKSSPTGVVYKPDKNAGLGIRAAVLFKVGSETVVDGEASFEISFNKNWGVNYVGLFGSASFMATIPGTGDMKKMLGDKFSKIQDKLKDVVGTNQGVIDKMNKLKVEDPSKAASQVYPSTLIPGEAGLTANVGIQYDFNSSVFHANFDLYINTAGGLLRGTASGNRAGWAVFHVAPGEWYIHMGTPTDRLGVQFGIGDFNIKTGAYLMLGDKIPGSPPPPKEVADILGVDMAQLDYMRDLNSLGDGRGFAFGANVAVSTGDINFLILYANFAAGVGFDIMLKDYGDAQCVGKSGPIGINGWYANGQAYAYLQGEVGVKVNLLFIKGKFPIIKGAAAALLQAKLPNPAWFRGYMGVQFNILGGLVKGKARLKITIGKECEIEGINDNPVGVAIISDLTPKMNDTEVDVFAAPQVAFNMIVGSSINMEDDEGTKTYRVKLEKFEVQQNGRALAGNITWNSNNDLASFYSHDILPPKTTLKAYAKVSFEQLKGGVWQTVYTNGKKTEEEKEVTFTTGTAPETIPLSNVEYSYPVINQQNFYKEESSSGYIRLKRGQPYLFNAGAKQEIRITSASQNFTIPFIYSEGPREVQFKIPDVALKSVHQFNLVSIPQSVTGSDQDNYQQVISSEGNSIEVRNKQANEVKREDVLKTIIDYQFKSSAYTTFSSKMEKARFKQTIFSRITSDVISLETEVSNYEPFDLVELIGSEYSASRPLVSAVADLAADNYYLNDIYPLIYQEYPVAGNIVIKNRDINEYGLIPAKAMTVMGYYLNSVKNNQSTNILNTRIPYVYNLPLAYKLDFLDLQNQVVNRLLNSSNSAYNKLVLGYYPFIRYGSHPVKLQYIMPNGFRGTEVTVDYFNEIR